MANFDADLGPLTRLELEQIAASQQEHRDRLARRLRRSHALPDDTADPNSDLDTDAWVALLVQIATLDGLDGLASLPQTRDDLVRGLERRGQFHRALDLCAVDDHLLTRIVVETRRQLLDDGD